MKAVIMNLPGGPEVLEYVERPDLVPGPREALVEVAAAGVNFMDTGARRGLLGAKVAGSKILGVEGAGRVLAIGENAADIGVGQRVA